MKQPLQLISRIRLYRILISFSANVYSFYLIGDVFEILYCSIQSVPNMTFLFVRPRLSCFIYLVDMVQFIGK